MTFEARFRGEWRWALLTSKWLLDFVVCLFVISESSFACITGETQFTVIRLLLLVFIFDWLLSRRNICWLNNIVLSRFGRFFRHESDQRGGFFFRTWSEYRCFWLMTNFGWKSNGFFLRWLWIFVEFKFNTSTEKHQLSFFRPEKKKRNRDSL